jgi:hypothetical protein
MPRPQCSHSAVTAQTRRGCLPSLTPAAPRPRPSARGRGALLQRRGGGGAARLRAHCDAATAPRAPSREFDEWREDAWRTWHRAAASTAPAAIPAAPPSASASAASPADSGGAAGGGGAVSPRALTAAEAEALVEPARLHAIALERQASRPAARADATHPSESSVRVIRPSHPSESRSHRGHGPVRVTAVPWMGGWVGGWVARWLAGSAGGWVAGIRPQLGPGWANGVDPGGRDPPAALARLGAHACACLPSGLRARARACLRALALARRAGGCACGKAGALRRTRVRGRGRLVVPCN